MRRNFTIICLIVSLFSFAKQGPGIIFKENKNQWPNKVRFGAEFSTGQIFIEQQGLTWELYDYADIQRDHHALSKDKSDLLNNNGKIHGHVFKVEFENAQLDNFETFKKQPEYYNYFLGNDPSHWASDVKAYEQVYFKNIYEKVDARFYSSNTNFKYDLIIKPGGNVAQIKLKYHYTNGISLLNDKLIIKTSIGEIIENIPEAYQMIKGKKIHVECKYVLYGKDQVSFKLGENYDPGLDLIIDPVVVVASYSGTKSVSFGLGVAPDSKGNMYLYSLNITKNYPITVGAVQTSYAGGFYDCTLSKFNAIGTSKRFSTYIGGNSTDLIINCVIQNNEVAIFGSTRSDTFPIIKNGFQPNYGGNADYFIIKLDTSGKNMIGSTYLGGARPEGGSSIGSNSDIYTAQNGMGEMIMDKWNNCYVIGCTYSQNFPTTPGCYRMYSDSNGASDLIITKMNRDLSMPIWSTYYGGSAVNCPTGIRISRSGKLYCGGCTSSRNFPTTPGVVYTTSVSTLDMIAFNMDTLGGFPIASTYLGSKNTEALRFDIDPNDNVYMIGYCLTAASTISATPGAYNVSTGHCAFYKLDPNLTQINAIARFGYTNITHEGNKIQIDAFNIDSCGYVYFGGFGFPSLPVTSDAYKSVGANYGNIYLGVFNPGFTSLKYASYYGANPSQYGDHDDGGLNYFDDRGYFYHGLCIYDDLPLTPNAYSAYSVIDSLGSGPNATRNSDAFIKIDLQTFINANSSLGGQIISCSPITATFATNHNLGSVTIIPGDGFPAVNSNSLVHTYNAYGTYSAYVIAGSDSSTCNIIDSIKILIKYGPQPAASLADNSINCNGNTLILDAGNSGANYIWNTGETSQTIKPTQSGKYWVVVDNDFCKIKDSTDVLVEEGHDLSTPNAFTPNNDGENDSFCLKGWNHCNEKFKVIIFSRWGEKVFESEDPDFCWNGIYKGKLLSADVYVYQITASFVGDQQVNKKGNITLIR